MTSLPSPWRTQFPVANDPGTTYLNTAGEGPLCVVAEGCATAYVEQKRRPYTKTITDAFTVPASIRERGAALIGADPSGCAAVPSTSYGMNIVAQGFPWQSGDRVLAFAGEFPACIYPFLNLEARGVSLDLCPSIDGIPDYAALEGLITPRTRMLVSSWVQFFNGFTHDLTHLKALCDRVGALLVLDITQGVGLLPLDCRALGVDVATLSGHKTLCAPVGSGLFYLDPRHRDLIPPTFMGWLSQMPGQDFNALVDYRMLPDLDGRRFETGSDAQVVLGWFDTMLAWFLEQGVDRLSTHTLAVVAEAAAGLAQRGYDLAPPEDYRGTVLSFRATPPEATKALHRTLWDAGVICSMREGWIRLSFHCFNDGSDVERLMEVLDRVAVEV